MAYSIIFQEPHLPSVDYHARMADLPFLNGRKFYINIEIWNQHTLSMFRENLSKAL